MWACPASLLADAPRGDGSGPCATRRASHTRRALTLFHPTVEVSHADIVDAGGGVDPALAGSVRIDVGGNGLLERFFQAQPPLHQALDEAYPRLDNHDLFLQIALIEQVLPVPWDEDLNVVTLHAPNALYLLPRIAVLQVESI